MRTAVFILSVIGIVVIASCAAPRGLPEGPTPIPTLIPATQPSSPLLAAADTSFTIQSYPASLPSAEAGKPIYDEMCASCHGADGAGAVPGARNFGDLDYMRGETPASFYAAITEGRRDMPAFRDRLTSDERWDVLFYIWRFSTNSETLDVGKQIYEANCVACHGTDGTGAVLGAADLTDLRLVDSQAPRDFYLVLTQGKDSMPAWQGRLSQEERWATIDYLRTFSYEPSMPGEPTAGPPPTETIGEETCGPEYLSQSNPFGWEDSATLASGRLIYDQACAACHGADGSGALPNTPDYTLEETREALASNSGEALCIVAEGRNNMPGWKETLTEDEMWQVLTYLASIGSP